MLIDLHDTSPSTYVDGVNPFGGVPTFGKFAHLDWRENDLAGTDVAILGVPYDNSAANRPGCRFGPRALRANALTAGYHHLTLGVTIPEWLEIRDVGDVFCPHGLSKVSLRNAKIASATIAAQVPFTVFVGGDHSITWPAVLGVAETHGWGRLGVIHFDAHADAAPQMEGNFASHATPMRRLLESGALAAFEQIGLRGYWPEPAIFEFLLDAGARWHLMDDVLARGIDAVLDDVIARMNQTCDAVYISVDIDVLDPGFAPGTGVPEPGGMTPHELFRAVRRIALETNLVALDVMEFSPPFDHADITANNAHRTIFEVLAALASKKRAAQDGAVELPAALPRSD